MCGNRYVLILGVALISCIGIPTSVSATSTPFYDRGLWEAGLNGPYWDVNLAGDPSNPSDPNRLEDGDTLASGDPIHLPPFFTSDLRFNTDLKVEEGVGWMNYINPGSGNPLVLSGSLPTLADPSLTDLTGTFSNGFIGRKFGFEFSTAASSGTVKVTLSDGTELSQETTGSPQFFGWIAADGTQIDSFSISFPGNEFTIGNFVVPEHGQTVLLLGMGFLAVFGLGWRQRSAVWQATHHFKSSKTVRRFE